MKTNEARVREEERSIAAHLEGFLRGRGISTTVTVTHEGEARFFASSLVKVPLEVWQAAIDDLHSSSRVPVWMLVSATPQSSAD